MISRSRSCLITLLPLTIAAAAGSAVAGSPAAEVPLSTEGGARGTIFLLRMKVVQDELELAPPLLAEIEDLHVDLLGALRRHRLRGPSDRQPAAPAQTLDAAARIMSEHHRRAAEKLSRRQSTRLDQLFVRYLGIHALLHPAVIREVQIRPDQLEAIREALETASDDRQLVLQLLSTEQQAQFRRLEGAEFVFPQRRPNAVILDDPR